MTSDQRPPDPGADHPSDPEVLDETASRLVDGDLGGTERDQALDDPVVRARAEAFGALRTRLADVPRPLDGIVDAAVARALAVADEVLPAADTGTVVPLERARRRRGWGAALPWVGAVAAAGLVVAGVASLTGAPGSSDLDVAEAPAETLAVAADERATTFGTEQPAEEIVPMADAPEDSAVTPAGGTPETVAPAGTEAPAAVEAPAPERAFVGEDEVTAFAATAPTRSTASACSDDLVLMPSATYQPRGTGTDTPAAVIIEVVLDTSSDPPVAMVYDLSTCAVLLQVPVAR